MFKVFEQIFICRESYVLFSILIQFLSFTAVVVLFAAVFLLYFNFFSFLQRVYLPSFPIQICSFHGIQLVSIFFTCVMYFFYSCILTFASSSSELERRHIIALKNTSKEDI